MIYQNETLYNFFYNNFIVLYNVKNKKLNFQIQMIINIIPKTINIRLSNLILNLFF